MKKRRVLLPVADSRLRGDGTSLTLVPRGDRGALCDDERMLIINRFSCSHADCSGYDEPFVEFRSDGINTTRIEFFSEEGVTVAAIAPHGLVLLELNTQKCSQNDPMISIVTASAGVRDWQWLSGGPIFGEVVASDFRCALDLWIDAFDSPDRHFARQVSDAAMSLLEGASVFDDTPRFWRHTTILAALP